MKIIARATVVLGLLGAGAAQAVCYGSNQLATCYDNQGNQYQVTWIGNVRRLQGSNSETGSVWNQTSTTIGNTTYHTGETNGRTWAETQTVTPGATYYRGVDSRSQPFSKICTAAGCY